MPKFTESDDEDCGKKRTHVTLSPKIVLKKLSTKEIKEKNKHVKINFQTDGKYKFLI